MNLNGRWILDWNLFRFLLSISRYMYHTLWLDTTHSLPVSTDIYDPYQFNFYDIMSAGLGSDLYEFHKYGYPLVEQDLHYQQMDNHFSDHLSPRCENGNYIINYKLKLLNGPMVYNYTYLNHHPGMRLKYLVGTH